MKEVKGLIRSVKIDLEHKLKIQIDKKHAMLSWLPAYVADVISRHRVRPDGRTAEKRRTGRN